VSRAPAHFPFSALPRVDRAAALFTRRVSAALAAAPPLPDPLLDDRWGALLGAPVRAHPAAPRPVTHDSLRAAWALDPAVVAVWSHPSLGTFLVALPRDLAFHLVTRCLGPEALRAPSSPLSDLAEGALSALAARVAVTLCAPSAPPTLRAITDHPHDALDALDAAPLVAWDFTLSGKTLSGAVTLVLSADSLRPSPRPPPPDLARFAEVTVPVRCVAGRAWLPTGAVASLEAGDRLMLDGLRTSSAGLSGDVTLCLGDAPPLRLDAALTDASRVTVTAPLRAPWSHAMNESTEVLRELRVEVTVEIAAQSTSLETLASWGPGAVVEFPQRLGEAVVVRAGGRVVARGELVDVEGQVGVRITERI